MTVAYGLQQAPSERAIEAVSEHDEYTSAMVNSTGSYD